MADQTMTVAEFGRAVKAKYPDYANVPDQEVGERMLAKYPEYQSRITTPSQQQPAGNQSLTGTMVRGATAALPVVGGVLGGMAGTAASPIIGTMAGVAGGTTLGEAAREMINQYALGDKANPIGQIASGAMAGLGAGVLSAGPAVISAVNPESIVEDLASPIGGRLYFLRRAAGRAARALSGDTSPSVLTRPAWQANLPSTESGVIQAAHNEQPLAIQMQTLPQTGQVPVTTRSGGPPLRAQTNPNDVPLALQMDRLPQTPAPQLGPPQPPSQLPPIKATFTKLSDGKWGLKGADITPGETIHAKLASGDRAVVQVGNIVSDENGIKVARIAGQTPATVTDAQGNVPQFTTADFQRLEAFVKQGVSSADALKAVLAMKNASGSAMDAMLTPAGIRAALAPR